MATRTTRATHAKHPRSKPPSRKAARAATKPASHRASSARSSHTASHSAKRAPERGHDDTSPRGDAGRALWSGTISFGLVTIPVNLFPAHRGEATGMRILAEDGTPLVRRWCCPKEDRFLEDDEIVRGYEIREDRFVVVTDEELEALAPRKSRDIDLRRFVPRDDIDPRYFEHGYFLAPATDSTKAYRLLAAVMEDTRRAGLATFVMRDKEYLVAILADRGVLSAETLRFADELRTPADVGLRDAKEKPRRSSVARVEKAIGALTRRSLDLRELEDDEADRLLALAARKHERGEGVVETSAVTGTEDGDETGAEIIDLMEVLKRSLGSASANGGRRRAAKSKSPRR